MEFIDLDGNFGGDYHCWAVNSGGKVVFNHLVKPEYIGINKKLWVFKPFPKKIVEYIVSNQLNGGAQLAKKIAYITGGGECYSKTLNYVVLHPKAELVIGSFGIRRGNDVFWVWGNPNYKTVEDFINGSEEATQSLVTKFRDL